jgi:hypothetical protein
MADRASASILIGGTLPHGYLDALLEAITLDHGRLDWEGEPVETDKILPGTPLEICAYDLPGGIFENVEGFCREHGLLYRRSSELCWSVWTRARHFRWLPSATPL